MFFNSGLIIASNHAMPEAHWLENDLEIKLLLLLLSLSLVTMLIRLRLYLG